MASKRRKATNISLKVKRAVCERDGGCCFHCGTHVGMYGANAHVIPRSKGGLGVEENIITACSYCHTLMDQTTRRTELIAEAIAYLTKKYPNLNQEDYVYRKGTYNKDGW